MWCGARLSQPLGYPLAGLTRHDRTPGCGTEAWFCTRSTRSLDRSVCVRAVRAGIQIQSRGVEGGRGSCRRWTGFRRDWKIRSIHPPRLPTTSSPSSSSSSPFVSFHPYPSLDFPRGWRRTMKRGAKRNDGNSERTFEQCDNYIRLIF